jgi:hypothetical protein
MYLDGTLGALHEPGVVSDQLGGGSLRLATSQLRNHAITKLRISRVEVRLVSSPVGCRLTHPLLLVSFVMRSVPVLGPI